MNSIYGVQILVTPDVPKMQLAPGDYITPEYRREIDAWLIEFFGTTNLLADGQVAGSELMGKAWMNPRTYAQFKAQGVMP